MLATRISRLALIGISAFLFGCGTDTTAERSSIVPQTPSKPIGESVTWIPILSQEKIKLIPSCSEKEVSCSLPSRRDSLRYGYRTQTVFTPEAMSVIVPEKIGRLASNFKSSGVEIGFEYIETDDDLFGNVEVCLCHEPVE